MTEPLTVGGESLFAALDGTALGGATAGAMLRASRESQGIHIAMLAAAIKVSPRKLDALEGDRYGELPDATFTRALAQTVCRALKIDAAPVLAKLPASSGMRLEPVGTKSGGPLRERTGHVESSGGLPQKPLLFAGGLLVLAAIALPFLPLGGLAGKSPEPAAMVPAPQVAAPSPAPAASAVAALPDGAVAAALPPATPANVVAANVPAANAMPAAAAAVSSTGPVLTQSPAVVTPGVPAAAVSASAALGNVGTAGLDNTGLRPNIETVFAAPPLRLGDAAPSAGVVLTATEATWVEISSRTGQVLLSRIVQPGETVNFANAAAVKLKIGNAAATRLLFRGQGVDLAPFTRENVARLELK